MEFLIGLLLWGLLWGLVGAVIGSAKGAAGSGFILCFLFGPLGVIIAIMGKGNRIRCPYCRKLVDPKATVCAYCQRNLKDLVEKGQRENVVLGGGNNA